MSRKINTNTINSNNGLIIGSIHSGRDTNIGQTEATTRQAESGIPSRNKHIDYEHVHDEAETTHNKELVYRNTRRLQALELQAASLGIDTPAHIINEIADIRAEINRLQRLLTAE